MKTRLKEVFWKTTDRINVAVDTALYELVNLNGSVIGQEFLDPLSSQFSRQTAP
jgi:hypothetical protein